MKLQIISPSEVLWPTFYCIIIAAFCHMSCTQIAENKNNSKAEQYNAHSYIFVKWDEVEMW